MSAGTFTPDSLLTKMIRPHPFPSNAGQGTPRQPYAAHEVDVDVALPLVVGDVLERRPVKQADVVHEDVYLAQGPEQVGHLLGLGKVRGEAGDVGARDLVHQPLHRHAHPGVVSSVDDDGGPLGGKIPGDGIADPLGRAADEGALAGQLQVHVSLILRTFTCPVK